MIYLKNLILAITLSLSTLLVSAQDKPTTSNIPPPSVLVEVFAGDRALSYQMIINKKLQSVPKLGFFGVSDIQPEWGDPKVNDFMLQGNMTYSIVRGIDLSSGFIWNPIDGIRPSAGAIFSYGNQKLLALVNPRVDLSKNSNFDALALIEYKPVLTNNLTLYSRIQGLYTHNIGLDFHARSYFMLRLGLTYRDFTFGAAANFDWYGPVKTNKNNFGGFLILNLF